MAGAANYQQQRPPSDSLSIEIPDATNSVSTRNLYHHEHFWNSAREEDHLHRTMPPEHDLAESQSGYESEVQGLGLSNISREADRIRRVPIGSKDSITQPKSIPRSGPPSGSLDSTGVFSQDTTAHNTPAAGLQARGLRFQEPSRQSSHQSLRDTTYRHIPSNNALLEPGHGEHECGGCPTHGDVLRTSMNWFTTAILILGFYSTVVSAVFLGIAIAKPRWGHKIGTTGSLSFSGATLLSALFSKTVELSFVTVFVATLGQLLSRKAFVNNTASQAGKGGISIAQLNMRLWIMQPGTLITNWIGVKYALPSLLGAATFVAAVSAIFYTTAAEGLVSPKLKMGRYEQQELFGLVSAAYANSVYLSKYCQTPIPANMEANPSDRGGTCLQIKHAGQGFHNFDSWAGKWAQKIRNAEILPSDGRPVPIAILYDNTTVNGQWITPSGENITADSKRWNRLVQNLTMVMPHANIFNAVRDAKNAIIQPADLQGAGEYVVKAAVTAPAVNILCAGLSSDELAPMIINNNTKSVPQRGFNTTLDAIFGWHPDGSALGEVAPWFEKAPKEYNTVANFTITWGQAGIYLLANPPNATITNDYILCGMRSLQYPNCTTSYHVADYGGNLTVHCDSDPDNIFPYSKIVPTAPVGMVEPNWKDVAAEWVRAVALSHGVKDGDAAIARMLTQMIPSYDNQTFAKLRAGMPSYGEALSVLSGSTLLLSSGDAPFKHEWTYSESPYYLEVPKYEGFQALVAYTDYASGGTQNYQGIFYVILLSTFLLNCWCLGYLVWNFWHYGHVTDYTEPQNLFALAMNSPPSNMLAGACGGGPSGHMLGKKWCVNMSRQGNSSSDTHNQSQVSMATSTGLYRSHPHFYVQANEDADAMTPQPNTTPNLDSSSWPNTPAMNLESSHFLAMNSPREALSRSKSKLQAASDRLRARKSLGKLKSMDNLRTVGGLEVDESPAVEQYMRLIGKG